MEKLSRGIMTPEEFGDLPYLPLLPNDKHFFEQCRTWRGAKKHAVQERETGSDLI